MSDTNAPDQNTDVEMSDLDAMSGGINPQPLPPNHPPEGGPHVD